MTIAKLVLPLVCLMSVTLEPKEAPEEAKVTPILSKDLADLPGKEGLMLAVEYPPGASDDTSPQMRMRLSMSLRAQS